MHPLPHVREAPDSACRPSLEAISQTGKEEDGPTEWKRASLDSSSVAPRGPKDRPEPEGQGKVGLEAPRRGRPRWHPALGDPLGRERPRLQGPGGSRGRHRTDPQTSWPTAQAPQEAACLAKGYDFPRSRQALRKRGIIPRIARRGIESSEKLGRYRWAVERTLSWINRFRRLKVSYERRDDTHRAFLDLGCALIFWRYVQRLC
jgi:transposase